MYLALAVTPKRPFFHTGAAQPCGCGGHAHSQPKPASLHTYIYICMYIYMYIYIYICIYYIYSPWITATTPLPFSQGLRNRVGVVDTRKANPNTLGLTRS